MNHPVLPRIGAACGAVFAIVLAAANGDGSGDHSDAREIAGVAALTLALPFLAYVAHVLREAEGSDGWLPRTALAAGVAGIALKLGSAAPELASQHAHLAAGTELSSAVDGLANGATVLSLWPLAVFCAATAAAALRSRALPRWLGVGAGVTAGALVANGVFVGTATVPALLLFVLWCLLASVSLLRRTWRTPNDAGAPGTSRASQTSQSTVSS